MFPGMVFVVLSRDPDFVRDIAVLPPVTVPLASPSPLWGEVR